MTVRYITRSSVSSAFEALFLMLATIFTFQGDGFVGSASVGGGVIVGGVSMSEEESSDLRRELDGAAFWGEQSG